MTADDIKALRTTLKCTARQLAQVLQVDIAEIVAWESGERFPTKSAILKMQKLAQGGMSALTKPASRRETPQTTRGANSSELLENPKLWKIVRRLLDDPAFFEQVNKMAETPEGATH